MVLILRKVARPYPILALLSLLVLPAAGPDAGLDAGGTPWRGGTMRLLAHAPAGSIDPQVNDTGQFWQIYAFTYDGLLATRKAGGKPGQDVVPDLADAMPVIEDGGQRYRFHLRPGIRFSDGRPVLPRDVAASFRRIFTVAGPTAGSFLCWHRRRGYLSENACQLRVAGRGGG